MRDIAGEEKKSARLQQAVEMRDVFRRDEAPPVMARFRPGIGIEQIDAFQRPVGQELEKRAHVTWMDSDVGELLRFDECQELRHAIDEGFGTDEGDFGMKRRLMRKMLAAAEADLKSDGPVLEVVARWIELELRQKLGHQPRVMRTQGLALAPPVELEAPFPVAHFTAALSALTRSVFSQEKPPSPSACRPKWP